MRAESAPELWLQGSTMAMAIGPPSHRRLVAPFSPPVCVPCGKWPKFMIACILGPRLDGRRNPVPNEMPPCKNNKCGVWTRVCVVIVSAMQVMLRRGGFFCFRLVLSLVDPTNCGSHRCHALTHFSLPAFTRHPSFNLLILRCMYVWTEHTCGVAPASFLCCRNMRRPGLAEFAVCPALGSRAVSTCTRSYCTLT